MGPLQLDFDELHVGLSGNLPIVGKVDLGTLREDLGEGAQFDLDCDCAVSGDELPAGVACWVDAHAKCRWRLDPRRILFAALSANLTV